MIALLLILPLQGSVAVDLAAESAVHGIDIRLGEIATITCSDPELASRLASFELGYAPAPGFSRYFRKAEIATELARAFPALDLEIRGEAGCRIEPLTETLVGEQLESTARAALVELVAGLDAELVLESPITSLEIPRGERPTSLRAALRDRGLEPGSRQVPVEILVDGVTYQTIWTSWKITVWDRLRVLARDLRRGEALSPACFELRRVERRTVSGEPLDPDVASGAIALRDLTAGSVLHTNDVERPRVIARGDLVHLEIRNGSITASTTVIAQQDGRLGDRIRVVQPDNRKELVVLVRSAELVEMRLGR